MIHVDLTDLNDATCTYLTKSVWFVMYYVMLFLCSVSITSCGFLFSKVNLHDPVVLSLVSVRIIFSYLMMWNYFVWRLPWTLHQTSWWWIHRPSEVKCVLWVLFIYGIFDRTFYLTWSVCPFDVSKLLWRYMVTIWTVSSGHDWIVLNWYDPCWFDWSEWCHMYVFD